MSEAIIKQMIPYFQTYGVRKAALFGSAARNQATAASDIDLVVSFGRRYDLLDIVGLKQDLEDELQTPVDLITYESLNDGVFAQAVYADERIIYG